MKPKHQLPHMYKEGKREETAPDGHVPTPLTDISSGLVLNQTLF